MIYLPHTAKHRPSVDKSMLGLIDPRERAFDLTSLVPKGIGLGGNGGGWRPYTTKLVIADGTVGVYDTMARILAIIGALGALSPWTKIFEKVVPPQQRMRFGYGNAKESMNQGYLWFCSIDTGTNFQIGKLRLVQCKSRDREARIVQEYDDTALHLPTVTTLTTATPTFRQTMTPLPEQTQFPMVGEDSILQLWYQCVTPATAEDDVGFSIPVTVYEKV